MVQLIVGEKVKEKQKYFWTRRIMVSKKQRAQLYIWTRAQNTCTS